MIIIPAIDLIDGKCVRLSKGDYNTKKIYNQNPLEVAKEFEGNGLEYLHLVDLDGAKKGEVVNWKVLDKIANNTNLKIDFSGGIKTKAAVEMAFGLGANELTIGSLALKNKDEFLFWISQFGANKFILGADVMDEKIAVHGWLETSKLSIFDYLKDYIKYGITKVMCTDISKDGMLQGPSFELYKNILKQFPTLNLIASGGVSNIEDVNQLNKLGCHAAIIGKAFYEGKILLSELK
jgi:phosphoribosylformimino-5-aminoimidazole carboxamide ribotide isomerase